MNLQHLCSAPHVTIYFDSDNQWLYVEWEGELTLRAVQHACLEVAQCFVEHAYPRVLNNNSQVTSITYDVTAWLAQDFLAHLHLAGVEQLAWVVAPSLRGLNVAQQAVSRLPDKLAIALFNDVEDAVHWLQQTTPPGGAPPARPAATEAQLTTAVRALKRELLAAPAAAAGQ